MKGMVKTVMNLIFLLLAIPLFLFYQLESLLIGREKAFQGFSQFVSGFAGLSGAYLIVYR